MSPTPNAVSRKAAALHGLSVVFSDLLECGKHECGNHRGREDARRYIPDPCALFSHRLTEPGNMDAHAYDGDDKRDGQYAGERHEFIGIGHSWHTCSSN